MPTQEDWQELMQNTTVTWTTQGGVNGRLFTAVNGNILFLPAAGYKEESQQKEAGNQGHYWSSSLNMNNTNTAMYLHFDSNSYDMDSFERWKGLAIRPVNDADPTAPAYMRVNVDKSIEDDNIWSFLLPQPNTDFFVKATLEPAKTYSVSIAEGTADKEKWTLEAEGATKAADGSLTGVAVGQQVTLKYSGQRQVKSVTAK